MNIVRKVNEAARKLKSERKREKRLGRPRRQKNPTEQIPHGLGEARATPRESRCVIGRVSEARNMITRYWSTGY